VDQPSGVGVMQCVGDRGHQLRGIPERRSSLCNPGRQIAAFDEIRHDERESVIRAAHVEDRHDVGMVQFGEDPGFKEKRFQVLGVGQPLERLARLPEQPRGRRCASMTLQPSCSR
jgi:hypothetical protein